MTPQEIMILRDPHARAEFFQEDVAGDLEEEIADEEDAGAGGESGVAQREILEHLQLGEADIDAIEIGEDVAEEEEREQADVGLVVSLRFKIFGGLRHGCPLCWNRSRS